MGRILGVLAITAVAVFGVGSLFVLANMAVGQARKSWAFYTGTIGAVLGGVGFGLLRGNRTVKPLLASPDPSAYGAGGGILGHIEWSIIGALAIGGIGFFVGSTTNRVARVGASAVLGIALGFLVGNRMMAWERPGFNFGMLVLWTAIGAAIGAASRYKSKTFVAGALWGASIGSIAGAWLTPDKLGTGSMLQASLAFGIPLALGLVAFAWPQPPEPGELAAIEERSRAFIFLAPAVTFLTAALIAPALITINLSFRNNRQRNPPIDNSENFVGLDNYRTVLGNEATLDLSGWRNLFTSQLFWLALVLILGAVLVGMFINYNRNRAIGIERTGGVNLSMAAGIFFFVFGVFSVLRGVLINNLWWVFTVTTLSTVLGLTIAVLSERAGRLERVAKAFVFMPMAVSFVGASIVWRIQYQARNASKNQTGVFNAVWVWLGKVSNSGAPRIIMLLILAAVLGWLGYAIVQRVRSKLSFAMPMAAFLAVLYPFVKLLNRNLGGFEIKGDEIVPKTVIFVQEMPFNNVFLMLVLVWIQTGFAMVILSAAIKAVPSELLEASELDGATPGQQFFQVVFPQILPTVAVVVTTLIVTVTKVFDIVKVMTGGKFGTEVLANAMYTEAFQFGNAGTGAALATLILVVILPVLVFNVYQLVKEDA